MGWSIGWDSGWCRDIGYGVPAVCDHPDCNEEIDRGLAYVCGSAAFGGEHGCGLYFCPHHLTAVRKRGRNGWEYPSLCDRCRNRRVHFCPKPDTLEWIRHKLTDESWSEWRTDEPAEVERLKRRLSEHSELVRRREAGE